MASPRTSPRPTRRSRRLRGTQKRESSSGGGAAVILHCGADRRGIVLATAIEGADAQARPRYDRAVHAIRPDSSNWGES